MWKEVYHSSIEPAEYIKPSNFFLQYGNNNICKHCVWDKKLNIMTTL